MQEQNNNVITETQEIHDFSKKCVLKVRDGNEILNVFQAIKTLVDEATFELTSEGLTFRGMDPSHVALIDVNLPKECFEEFTFGSDKPFKVGVQIDELVDTLKSIIPKSKKWDANRGLQFTYEDDMLHIKAEKLEANLRTIETSGGNCPLPKLRLHTEFTLESISDIKDFISFVAQHEYVRFSSEMTFDEEEYHKIKIFSQSDRGEYKETYHVKSFSTQASLACYSGDYLQKILKVLNGGDSEIKIQYSTKMPLRIETRPFQQFARLHFYLAPRVQD